MFETLTKGFRAARNRLAGLQELTADNIDPALRDVRLSLLEADVELGVVKAFLARVKERSIGQTLEAIAKSKDRTVRVGPTELFVGICQEELTKMMAFEGDALHFATGNRPTGIMMVGLQGSGKTTSAAKLARLLAREHGKKPLLVAADVQRPGAIDQLEVLGKRIDVPVFAIRGGRPTDICERGLTEARRLKCDVVVYDTAGRLAIDEPLMQELADIRGKVAPENVFFVVDAMIGQDAVKTAKSFHERLSLTGIVLTKLDGDARGGAALSVKEVTGAPVKFVGMGEDLERMEQFRAEGMASRILGMGDVVGLLKDFEGVVDEEQAAKDAQRMLEGRFTLDDFLKQIEMIQGMGPLKGLLEKLPFMGDLMPEGFDIDEGELDRVKAIVSSMTKQERRYPELFEKQPGRVDRVAGGCGRPKDDIAELLQRFKFMRDMMGSIGQSAGMLSKIPGMKQMAAARRMGDFVKAGGAGIDGNPMMQQLTSQLLEAAVAGESPLGGMPGGKGGGMPGFPRGMPSGFPGFTGGMPGGFPGGLPGGFPGGFPGFPGGMPGMPGFGAPPTGARKKVDKDAKRKERKKQKEQRRKSRK